MRSRPPLFFSIRALAILLSLAAAAEFGFPLPRPGEIRQFFWASSWEMIFARINPYSRHGNRSTATGRPLAPARVSTLYPSPPRDPERDADRGTRASANELRLLFIDYFFFSFSLQPKFLMILIFSISHRKVVFFLVTTSHSRCKRSGRIIDLTSAGLKIETAFPNGAAPTVC